MLLPGVPPPLRALFRGEMLRARFGGDGGDTSAWGRQAWPQGWRHPGLGGGGHSEPEGGSSHPGGLGVPAGAGTGACPAPAARGLIPPEDGWKCSLQVDLDNNIGEGESVRLP